MKKTSEGSLVMILPAAAIYQTKPERFPLLRVYAPEMARKNRKSDDGITSIPGAFRQWFDPSKEQREVMVMLIILEGLVMCLFLLLFCVIGIADGPVGLVVLYEQDVQDRVVELGLTTNAKIKRSLWVSFAVLYLPYIFVVPAFVYGLNGAVGFWDGFWQMTAIFLIQNVFDRIFVDWYWVGHTKAWEIPGTEDLKPYIPKKVMLGKWAATFVVNPLTAAILAWAVTAIF